MGEIKLELTELERQLQREKDMLFKELIQDIVVAKTELETATQNYNFADSDDLVDLYSYRIIAAQTKYNLLLKRAKEIGVSYNEYLGDSIKAVHK